MSDSPAYDGSQTLVRNTKTQASQSLANYVTERKIGEGGMASVFLASDLKANRQVALKVMLPHLSSNPDFAQRFLQEIKAAAALKNEHIVELFSYSDDASNPFIASEYIDGGTVQDLLAAMGKFPVPLAIELFAQLLEALVYAHGQGVIHRDLKPANLLLTRTGCLKVGDFGIAKTQGSAALTQTGMLLGTPAYMSPEQAMSGVVDARSDLYSSGVVLYELLTGSNPRESDNPTVVLARVLNEPLPMIFEVEPTVPTFVQELMDGLLARDREARFASAGVVLSRLTDEIARVRRIDPHLASDCIANPTGTKQRLLHDQAMHWYQRARDRMKAGSAAKEPAALWAYYAASLEPKDNSIQRLFTEICSKHRLNFGPSKNAKVIELEKLLEKDPRAPGVLQQLAQLYRLEGNIFRAVVYLKRYLKLRVNDGYAATQLQQLTGETHAARSNNGPNTNDLVAGIRTGGFRANAQMAPAASHAAASIPDSEPSADAELAPSSLLHQLWNAYGKKALLLVGAVLLVAFIAKRVNRAIDSTVQESTQAQDAMARAAHQAENARATEQTKRELAQISESNAKEAAQALEAATASFNKQDFRAAIAAFETLMERFPKRKEATTAQFHRAKAFLALGQNSKAIAAFSSYLDQHSGSPDYWEALLRRGQAHQNQLEDSLALSDFDTLIQKQPSNPWALEALVARGEVHGRLNQKDDAAADFKAALARTGPSDPLNARASNNLKGLNERTR